MAARNIPVADGSFHPLGDTVWNDTRSKLFDFVSVKDDGSVGNGTTSDTAAFTSSLTSAMSSGKALYLPKGTYYLPAWTQFAVTSDLTIFAHHDAVIKGTTSLKFLEPQGGRIRLQGVKFDTWEYVVEDASDTTYTTPELRVQDCWFTSVNFPIDHQRPCTSSVITFNRFDTTAGQGIRIGNNTYASQDLWLNHRIVGNFFKDIVGTTASDVHAMLIYGKHGVIADNIIDTVTGASTADVYGIYTKLRYGQIVNNNVRALTTSGSGALHGIAIKSPARADAASGVQGFAVVCANNSLFGSSVGIGISIQGVDVNCNGNYIEEWVVGVSTSGALSGLQITNNKIIGESTTANTFCIDLKHTGDDCMVSGNTLDTCDRAINIATGNTRNLHIDGNNIVNCSGVAVQMDATGTKALVSFTNNTIDGADRVIYLDGAITRLVITGNNYAAITDASNLWIDSQAELVGTALVANNSPVTLQTTDNTTTSGFKWHIPDNTAFILEAVVVAMESDGTQRAMYGKRGLFYRDGAGAVQQGSTQDIFADEESVATWTVTLGVTGNQARVLVEGDVDDTVNWSIDFKVHSVQ